MGGRERVSGKATKREAERAAPVENPQLSQIELFHLLLNIPARSRRIGRAKPRQLPAGKFWLVPPPPSTQTLALPLSQARTGKGRESRAKTTSKCSGAVFPLVRPSHSRFKSCLRNLKKRKKKKSPSPVLEAAPVGHTALAHQCKHRALHKSLNKLENN